MRIRVPHLRELSANLRETPVQPTIVNLQIRIDLDRGEIPIPQYGKSLLTFETQQSIRAVDVSAYNQRVVPASLQNLLDTERRSSRLAAALFDGDLHFGEQVVDVLTTATRSHQQEQVDTVARGNLDAGENNRSIFQARSSLLQLGDAGGSVVIGDCHSIETCVANRLHPSGPVRVCPVGFGLEVVRRRRVGMEIDAPPPGTGPVPRRAHASPPEASLSLVYQNLIVATLPAPTTPQSRS